MKVLLIQTLIACVVSITSNRHYLTQVVDGAALGIIYGLAARKNAKKWESLLQNESTKNRFRFSHFDIPQQFSTAQTKHNDTPLINHTTSV
jgi:hypothetical protein